MTKELTPIEWTLAVVVVGLLFTLAWNYGVTEIIQNLGGPDGNINVLEGTLAWAAVRFLQTK